MIWPPNESTKAWQFFNWESSLIPLPESSTCFLMDTLVSITYCVFIVFKWEGFLGNVVFDLFFEINPTIYSKVIICSQSAHTMYDIKAVHNVKGKVFRDVKSTSKMPPASGYRQGEDKMFHYLRSRGMQINATSFLMIFQPDG